MANSTAAKRQTKPEKPRPDFPLFPHQTGRWAKKVKGSTRYFGYIADDPKGVVALQKWLDQKDELLAGRTPANQDGLTVAKLCNLFLSAKADSRDSGELAPITFADYLRTCKILTEAFGRSRLALDLAADDFRALRAKLAKVYGPVRLGNTVTRIRTIFKWGLENKYLAAPVTFGSDFRKPSKAKLRAHRQRSGKKMFEANEIRELVSSAEQPLKAMILLGINCGFGNNDCGTLPASAIDLDRGWVNFPRPKTAVERLCPLWPETAAAIREAIARRPVAKNSEHDNLVFLTKYGHAWAKQIKIVERQDEAGKPETAVVGDNSPITKEFAKLFKVKKGHTEPAVKFQRGGRNFYALRHTFETIGGESLDQVAVNAIMGHVDDSMAGQYREGISDGRLQTVVDCVRAWLFPQSAANSAEEA